ncbi:MAG TPA: uroporphyrinogen decarboxylase family protein [Armatimonadota bacterium]|nr:uroporphyrinogen decarboxylase family protein [Armatimonadota bacterium]
MKRLTMRERLLAVLRGHELDEVPFAVYDGTEGTRQDIWDSVGRDCVGLLGWTSAHTAAAPHCHWETEDILVDGRRGLRTVLHTPAGSLVEEKILQPDLGVLAAYRHFVRVPRDYEVLLAYLRDVIVSPSPETCAATVASLGDDGLPHLAVDRTPFQQLWIQWVCLEDLCLHLVDCPEIVRDCMDAMGALLRREFEAACRASAPYVVIPDNITAPAIGPRLFREYCIPYYRELAAMLGEHDMRLFVHMDGDLRPLWADIADSGVGGIDSLSPPPDNDTSVAAALSQWPDMRLFVNFPSSVHLAPPEQVYAQTAQMLAEGKASGRLEIQISENLPPGRWRVSYPAIVAAIRDLGQY